MHEPQNILSEWICIDYKLHDDYVLYKILGKAEILRVVINCFL